jgi:phosphoribosyl 1,2-cyclic phosphodiesterase
LVDVGMGVVPSLLEFEGTHGVHVVHEVLFTHPHFDHFAQIDWLSMALLRNLRDDQPRPLPIYATRACWDNGPNALFRYLAERSSFRPIEPGSPITLADLVITPFTVDHGPKAPGAVGYVVQHGRRKIVLTGDFLHVPDEDNPLLCGADVCFMDANTWHPAEWTSHQSVMGNLRLIDKWRPKRAYFVHYSGYEDRERPGDRIDGPLSLARLQQELHRISDGRDLRAAQHGMVLGDTVAWPD